MADRGGILDKGRELVRRVLQPDGTAAPETHVPVVTMDNEALYHQFMSKQFGSGIGGAMVSGTQTSRLYRSGPQRLRQLAQSYGGTQDSVSWVFNCVSYVAATLGSYPYHFEDDEGDTVEEEHVPPDLKLLLEHPNPKWTYFDLAEMMCADCELVGQGYLLKNERTPLGKPKSLFRLRPDCVRIATAPDGTIVGYVYTPPTIEGGYGSVPIPYDASEIIHFKYPNPLDEHYGMGTVEAIAGVLDEHTAERLHVTGFFQNGGRISGVLTVNDNLTDTQFERLKRSYQEQFAGGANAYKVLIAEKANDYKPITTPPVASGVVDLMKLSKDEILSGFNVPAPLLGGVMENANYKMEESQHIFLRGMLPRSRRFAERMTLDLVAMWELVFKVDAHANEPMEVRIAHGKEMLQAGAKLNESREVMGLEPWDDPMAEIPMIPNTLIPATIAGLPPRPGRTIPMGENGEPGAPKPGEPGGPPAPEGSSLSDQLADLPSQIASGSGQDKASAADPILVAVERMAEAFERRLLAAVPAEVPIAEQVAEAQERAAAAAGASGAFSAPLSSPAPQPSQPSAQARGGSQRRLSAAEAAESAASAWGKRQPRHLHAVEDEPEADDWAMPDFPEGFEAPPGETKSLRTEQRAIREHQARVLRLGLDVFAPALKGYFREERDRVMHALSQYGSGQRAVRKGRGRKDLTPDKVFDLAVENEAIIKMYLAAIDQVGAVAVQLPEAVGQGISWSLENPLVEQLRDTMAEKVTRVNQTTKDQIAKAVEEGMRRGYSIPQIANGVPTEEFPGVMGVFDQANEYRAEMIARSESAMAFNGAISLGYREAGTQWVEVMDGTMDAACAEANGAIWSIDDFEGDPIGHPNCTRTAVPSTQGPSGEPAGGGDSGDLGDAGA